MKLRNTTDFDSAAIRSLIRSVVREVEATLVKSHPGRRHGEWSQDRVKVRAIYILRETDIWVRQRRNGETHPTGNASYSARTMTLTLGDASVVSFLWLARHEVWHLFGVKHEDFPAAIMHNHGGAYTSIREVYSDVIARWGVDLPKAKTQVKVKTSPEGRAFAKLLDIEAKQKRWTTKLKRAQTALKKLKASQKYYEKSIQVQVAAARKPRVEE